MPLYDSNGNTINRAYDSSGNLLEKAFYPVSENIDLCTNRGKLQKIGKYLCGADGKQIELRGIGLHTISQFKNLHNVPCFTKLREYGINVIRCSLYLEDSEPPASEGNLYTGYVNDIENNDAEIEKIVGLCVDLGLYVMLDWHMVGTGVRKAEAEVFFDKFSRKYANLPNIIYELANEPWGATDSGLVAYVKDIRDIILANDPDALMVTGTNNTASDYFYDLLEAEGITDVFISNHVYADNKSQLYYSWWDEDIPMFNTEWGNTRWRLGEMEGNDSTALANLTFYHDTGVSNCFWKFSDQAMGTSALKNREEGMNSEYYLNGFTEDDLSHTGALYLNTFKSYATKRHCVRLVPFDD